MRLTILAGLGTACLATGAIAGYVQPFPVEVDLKNRDASGDLVTARYSRHKNVHIGCGMRKLQNGAGGVFTFGFCQAEDAAKESILCNTQDPALLEAIASSADYGFITFSWDTNNVCTRIGFSNQSFYLPRGLDDNI